MNTPRPMLPAGSASSLAMVRTLGGIAMLSGILVVLAYQLSLPRIQANKQRAIEHAVFKVIPGIVRYRAFVLTDSALLPGGRGAGDGTRIYAGYDRDGTLKGIATEAAARGYQDVIRILYGYAPDCRCITGMVVLQSTETPGLGDKIESDAAFQANFHALDARLNAAGTALAHEIKTVKHGTKSKPWQIDAVSGATVSSQAIGRMLNESAGAALPRVHAHMTSLEKPSWP